MLRHMLLPSILLCGTLGTGAMASQWEAVTSPSRGPSQAIGSYANGCLAGGEELPLQGEGYQVIRAQRSRYYGHRDTVRFLTDFSKQANSLRLGYVLVADVAMPRGGPFSSGHASHQTGLDADIWMRIPEDPLPAEQLASLAPLPMVDLKKRRIDKDNWTDKQARLIQLAASDSRVSRLFVHPLIKEQLCLGNWPQRDWLRKVRPWWGHFYHFHVRLACPQGSSHCQAQPLPPKGDGCGAELSAWKRKVAPMISEPEPSRNPPKKLPRQCMVIASR